MSISSELPKYLMKVNGNMKFLSFTDASIAYDNGWVRVEFGPYVLGKDYSIRKMSDEERLEISDAADEYSMSK